MCERAIPSHEKGVEIGSCARPRILDTIIYFPSGILRRISCPLLPSIVACPLQLDMFENYEWINVVANRPPQLHCRYTSGKPTKRKGGGALDFWKLKERHFKFVFSVTNFISILIINLTLFVIPCKLFWTLEINNVAITITY